MTTSRLAAACDPSQWVQSLIAINVQVNKETYRYAIIKPILQGSLSTVTAAACIPAFGGEIIKLVGDVSCKATGGAIRGFQYIGNPAWLENFYQTVSGRPSLSHRLERIIGEAFGLFISAVGTFFLLVIRNDWAIQQHQSLGNYIPPIDKPAESVSTGSAERKEAVPPIDKPTEPTNAAAPKLKGPPPLPPREEVSKDASSNASISPAGDAPEVPFSAPPPAPPPPSAPTAPAVAKEPKKGQTLLEEIAAKGGKDRKAFTFKKRAIKSSSTMQKNLSGAMDRQMKPLRIQSECITFSGVAIGYTVKGRTTLREAAEAMDIDFPVDDEKDLDGKLADYIQDLSPPGPLKIGAVIEMQNEDYPDRSFTIQITKVEDNTVIEATIKYLMLNLNESEKKT